MVYNVFKNGFQRNKSVSYESHGSVWYTSWDKYMSKYKATLDKLCRQGKHPYGVLLYTDREERAYHFSIFTDKEEFEMVEYMELESKRLSGDERFVIKSKIFEKR